MHPVVGETFNMETNVAAEKVLNRPVSGESAENRQLERNSFWILQSNMTIGREEEPRVTPLPGVCSSALRCSDLVRWGARRKVQYFGRNGGPAPSNPRQELTEPEGGDEEKGVLKRPAETSENDGKQKKKKRPRRDKDEHISSSSMTRWAKERYKSAELKVLDIMREKKAVLGRPILRNALRSEARNHIGDTGLLDHLLKHMDGKVDRGERFRRRHNADGHMEYWLEPAELAEQRRLAGVNDPYWTPPPGWKPGDGLIHDSVSAMELKRLKEEVAGMKRLKEEIADISRCLNQMMKKNNEDEKKVTPRSITTNLPPQLQADQPSLQESYKILLNKNTKLEERIDEISNKLNRMQEELKQLKGEKEKKEEGDKQAARKVLKSSFRICKPQGTFLWPNSGGSMSPGQLSVTVEDMLVPTPPSASSTTSAPPLPRLLPTASSPVKTVPVTRVFSNPISSAKAVLIRDAEINETWVPLQDTGICGSPSAARRGDIPSLDAGNGSRGKMKEAIHEDSWLALATPCPSVVPL